MGRVEKGVEEKEGWGGGGVKEGIRGEKRERGGEEDEKRRQKMLHLLPWSAHW